jgi:hypothetical protein
LRREGWTVGKRQIQRLRRDEGLRVPPSKRKIIRRGFSTGLPTTATHRNHVWTWDFIADATVRGGSLRMLTILDEYTRECHVLWAERALKSTDVLEWLQKAIAQHGAPERLRSDIPSYGRATPSLRWGWTKNKQKHNLNHVPGLTHGLDQKSEPGHLRVHELCAGVQAGEIVVFDRAYVDFAHLADLSACEDLWFTRAKENLQYLPSAYRFPRELISFT